jgi:NAD(P)-dependent dehydrogenase (short-subunit alcohol dehydrogenase family)
MANELNERVAIVTGGARGIGLAIAQDLHKHGASVVIVDNGVTIGGEPESPRAAEAALASMPGAIAITGDIAEPGLAEEAVKRATSLFGGVDIIVNNAAIIRDAFVFKANLDAWDAVIRTNLTGAYRLLAAATPAMREQVKAGRAPGSIVNIVSTAGIYGNFGQAAYGAAKNGLIALTRVVAHDLARSKITCNAVTPFAATRVTESIQPANDAQAAYKTKALQVSPLYVARLVSFLASSGGAHISGQLFGARGRELFLFSQPRPKVKVTVPTGAHPLADMASVIKGFEPDFTDLVTDLEAFSADPLL